MYSNSLPILLNGWYNDTSLQTNNVWFKSTRIATCTTVLSKIRKNNKKSSIQKECHGEGLMKTKIGKKKPFKQG